MAVPAGEVKPSNKGSLASGQADALSGRYLAAPGAPDNLQNQTDRIVKDNLHLLRIRS
jgi:hypothetical protein